MHESAPWFYAGVSDSPSRVLKGRAGSSSANRYVAACSFHACASDDLHPARYVMSGTTLDRLCDQPHNRSLTVPEV